jgi:hypothetical protein
LDANTAGIVPSRVRPGSIIQAPSIPRDLKAGHPLVTPPGVVPNSTGVSPAKPGAGSAPKVDTSPAGNRPILTGNHIGPAGNIDRAVLTGKFDRPSAVDKSTPADRVNQLDRVKDLNAKELRERMERKERLDRVDRMSGRPPKGKT